MKKSLKYSLTSMTLLSPFAIALISASCNHNEKYDLNQNIKELKSYTVELEKIIDFEEEELEKNNASNLLAQINEIKEDENDLNKVKILLKNTKEAINSFNERNKQEKSGLVINKIVLNQEEVIASSVVEELKNTKNWNEVKTIFNKFSISVEEKELRENEELTVASSTHAHDEEGEIHLDINFKLSGSKERFTLLGFKKVEPFVDFLNWKFALEVSKEIADEEQKTLIEKLKAEQQKGFNDLFKYLNTFTIVEKVRNNHPENKFKIIFDDQQNHTKVEEHKLFLYLKAYQTGQEESDATIYLVINLEKDNEHHED